MMCYCLIFGAPISECIVQHSKFHKIHRFLLFYRCVFWVVCFYHSTFIYISMLDNIVWLLLVIYWGFISYDQKTRNFVSNSSLFIYWICCNCYIRDKQHISIVYYWVYHTNHLPIDHEYSLFLSWVLSRNNQLLYIEIIWILV